MATNKVICTKNEVDYLSIRKAMTSGARTVDEYYRFRKVSKKA